MAIIADEKKTGSGSLFKNDRKESDKHPDYSATSTKNNNGNTKTTTTSGGEFDLF